MTLRARLDQGARFAQLAIFGDEARYVFFSSNTHQVVSKCMPLPRLGSEYPALTWPEHEAGRFLGARFDTPEPQRADPLSASEALFAFPYGPVRQTHAEATAHRLISGGELIVELELRPFLKRRNVEQTLSGASLMHLPRMAERITGLSSLADTLAVVQAVETLLGLTPPPEAAVWRVILAELERLYSHADYLAKQAGATTLRVGEARAYTLKEELQRVAYAVSGSRFVRGVLAVGGLAMRPDAAPLAELRNIERRMEAHFDNLTQTELFMDRLRGAGQLSKTEALALGLVGPSARASGLREDLRIAPGYAAYPQLGLGLGLRDAGDAQARFEVRMEEIFVSFSLIRRAVEALTGGPIGIQPPPPVESEALGFSEGPRGETLAYVKSDGQHLKFALRPASAMLWPAFAQTMQMVPSQMDYLIVEVSFHPLQAGWDR